MENRDRELIQKVLRTNIELKRLYQEHMVLEEKLNRFEKRTFLLPIEELEARSLKKKKLHGVDKMMSIISNHRVEQDAVQ